VKHPSKVLQVGQEIEAVVLEMDMENRRISLGLKQTEADPWTTLAERYVIGSVISGGSEISPTSAHSSKWKRALMAWFMFPIFPRADQASSEVLKKGEHVEAVILNIDTENHRCHWASSSCSRHLGAVFRGAYGWLHGQRKDRTACSIWSIC
jgi:Ribosomal protein S1